MSGISSLIEGATRSRAIRVAVRRASVTLKEQHMLDIILLAFGLGLFALTVGYAYACERL